MGWLRDLMLDAGLRSFGALARASLLHAAWPADSKAQQRSLAAMFSRFDHDKELDWLAERPAVQQVLSELLHCPVGDIRAPLLRANENQASPARLRLEALHAARALEFAEEPLPPGFPPDLSAPSSWDRLLWLTSPGSGRTIAGQWLDVRGRAENCPVGDGNLLRELPTTGPPLFIEVRFELDDELRRWKPERAVCLAADEHALNVRLWTEAGWRLARSRPIETCLESIVLWVAQRLGPQSRFDAERVATWLREDPLADGLIETFGDVLGWCGLVSEVGLESTRRRDKNQTLALLVKRALAPLADRRDIRGAGLTRKAPDLLVAMAERSLLLPTVDWMAARSLEAWVDLLPDEERLGPDVDWMRAHLVTASKSIRARDVERAAARFPPGAHRWLGLLRDAGLLRPVDAENFVLRPHFLARLALEIAKGSLIQASSAVWGEALFHGRTRASLWPHLQRRAAIAPETLVEAVLEDLEEESPSSVLALDAAVVALGLSQLSGHEVPAAASEQLLDEASALALKRPDEIPRPRIGIGLGVLGSDSGALWWLALLALSENAARTKQPQDPRIMPWLQREPPQELARLFDQLLVQFQGLARPLPVWLFGAFALVERLRQTLGPVISGDELPHPMHVPGIVLDEVVHGVLEWSTVEPLIGDELLFEVFEVMAQQRGCTEATWADGFWQAFAQADFELPARGFVQRHLQRLAPHVPSEMGIAWLEGSEKPPCDEIIAVLPPAVLLAWLDQSGVRSQAFPPNIVRAVSEEMTERLLADLEPRDEAILPILWERVPDRVVSRIHRFRVLLPEKAARWIDCAPVTYGAALFKAAEIDEWLKASAPFLLALRRFCCRCIDDRSDDWQLGYAWLVKIERVLRQ